MPEITSGSRLILAVHPGNYLDKDEINDLNMMFPKIYVRTHPTNEGLKAEVFGLNRKYIGEIRNPLQGSIGQNDFVLALAIILGITTKINDSLSIEPSLPANFMLSEGKFFSSASDVSELIFLEIPAKETDYAWG